MRIPGLRAGSRLRTSVSISTFAYPRSCALLDTDVQKRVIGTREEPKGWRRHAPGNTGGTRDQGPPERPTQCG